MSALHHLRGADPAALGRHRHATAGPALHLAGEPDDPAGGGALSMRL
jgi:hypothetical protein